MEGPNGIHIGKNKSLKGVYLSTASKQPKDNFVNVSESSFPF